MRKHPYYNILVSEEGEVRSLPNNRLLKQRICRNGYVHVSVSIGNGKSKACRVHRIVAETYIDNPLNLPEIDHIDCDKLNNSVSNLEWVTSKENKRRAILNGLYFNNYGDRHHNNKYSEELVREICKSLQVGLSNKEIVVKFNVPKDLVAHIKRGDIWKDVSREYDIILKRKPRKDIKLVHDICLKILEGYSDHRISELFDVPSTEVSRIRRKKSHKKISDLYWVQRLSND